MIFGEVSFFEHPNNNTEKTESKMKFFVMMISNLLNGLSAVIYGVRSNTLMNDIQ